MAHLRFTKNAEIGQVTIRGFPLILGQDGAVHWLSLAYFLELHQLGVVVGSLKTYAQHVVDFITQLEVDQASFMDVTDGWLTAFRDSIKSRTNAAGKKNTENYVTQVLRSVIHFLYWLEKNKYIRGVIGAGKLYKVRVLETPRGLRHPSIKDHSKDKRKSVTPRSEWIQAVKGRGPRREDLNVRFELMISWGQSLGLRAMEICNLCVADLPGLETAQRAVVAGKQVNMRLMVTKGGKEDMVPVSPLLVKKTWAYIHAERSGIVATWTRRARKRHESYQEPDHIFLSDKTGQKLDERSFSNSVRAAFLSAVEAGELTIDERVWVHGLRHNFVANLLRDLDKRGVRRPEAVARQVTRHRSEDAMEPYLTDRYNEDFHG